MSHISQNKFLHVNEFLNEIFCNLFFLNIKNFPNASHFVLLVIIE